VDEELPGLGHLQLPASSGLGDLHLRAGTVALCIASVEDIAVSTYDFHATHSKINLIM
jgi:hypothetical protein